MTTYYFETKTGNGKFQAASDEQARNEAKKLGFMVCYRESNSQDGTPLVIVFESETKNETMEDRHQAEFDADQNARRLDRDPAFEEACKEVFHTPMTDQDYDAIYGTRSILNTIDPSWAD